MLFCHFILFFMGAVLLKLIKADLRPVTLTVEAQLVT
jgi:hypothetical protein